jgi:hypothetical protein
MFSTMFKTRLLLHNISRNYKTQNIIHKTKSCNLFQVLTDTIKVFLSYFRKYSRFLFLKF